MVYHLEIAKKWGNLQEISPSAAQQPFIKIDFILRFTNYFVKLFCSKVKYSGKRETEQNGY